MPAPLRPLLTSQVSNHPIRHCVPPECPCCRALRIARERSLFDPLPEWHSPLTPGVQRINLTLSESDRTIHAALGRDWARMLDQLPALGRALVMTRNAAAILGRQMTYPALGFTSDGGKGASGQSGLWVDLRHFDMARAVHRRCEAGHIFGVEFADEEGRIVHRFTLTPESDFDGFFEWVRAHQACAAVRAASEELESAPSPVEPSGSTRRSGAGAIIAILNAARERLQPVQVIVNTHGLRQEATLRPAGIHREDSWWFVSDGTAGIHFDPSLLHRVEIVERRSGGEGAAHPILRCSSDEQDAALVLAAAPETPAAPWRELLQTLA